MTKHFVIEASSPEVDLVTVKNVPIMKTGTFNLSRGGNQTFTKEDLEAAAEASIQDDAILDPRMGVGHESDLGDGEPSFGTFKNLRVTATGQGSHTLYADAHGVPRWLAKIMPSAFPSRSIEGERDFVSASGKTHKLMISAVKLLGVILPGISTLSDLRHSYGSEQPEGTTILASFENPDSKVIVVNTDHTNPSKEEVRQVDPKALREQLGLAETATDAEVDSALADLKALREEKAAEAKAAEEKAKAEAAKAKEEADKAKAAAEAAKNVPEGLTLIDNETLASLQLAASRANELHASAVAAERDSEVNDAVKAGKIPRSRREHYTTLYKADPEGTKALFASMAPGLIPVGEELGNSGEDGGAEDEVYPESLLSVAQRAVVMAAREGKSHLTLKPGEILTDKVG